MPLNRRHFLFGALAAPVLAATKKHAVAARTCSGAMRTRRCTRRISTGWRKPACAFITASPVLRWGRTRALSPLRAITVTEVALQRRLASFWTRRLPRSRFSWRSPGPVRTPWRRRRRIWTCTPRPDSKPSAGTPRRPMPRIRKCCAMCPPTCASTQRNPAALIKSHHNVGGLPKKMKFALVEPLKCLFKDEVRQLGIELGLPKEIVLRQPFPGPGLAVRILGEVTPERCAILRNADAIVVEEMKSNGLYYKIWQSFAVLLPVRSVGVMGDERTYDYTIAIRAVESQDGMTADWVKLPYELLEKLASRIINEVKGVNRCVFDITSKPPGTIEWE